MTKSISQTLAILAVFATTVFADPRVSANEFNSLKINRDGTVAAWGDNSYGQLGDGTTTARLLPVQVLGLNNIIAVHASSRHSLAVRSDGTVWAWGSNQNLQLGTTGISRSLVPLQVQGLQNVVAVASTQWHGFALRSDGSVWSWGVLVDFVQPTPAQATAYATPTRVNGLSDILSLSAYRSVLLAVRKDGKVISTIDSASGNFAPEQVASVTGATAASEGESHALALQSDGTVWGWGTSGLGALGVGPDSPYNVAPWKIPGIDNVKALTACNFKSYFVKRDGTLWILTGGATQAAQVPGTGTVDAVACGRSTTALAPDGSAIALGAIEYSGTGLPGYLTRPTTVPAWANVSQLAPAWWHTLALRPDGSVLAVGSNFRGQLGFGNQAALVQPAVVPVVSDIVEVSARNYTSLAVQRNGSLWSWGGNFQGQLGDGTMTDSWAPRRIPTLAGVASASAGHVHSVALGSDGSVWAWGYNGYGQVNGSPNRPQSQLTPLQVPGLPTDMIQVQACENSSLALRRDGTVWYWGDGRNISPEQVSGGPLVSAQVPGLNGVIRISCNSFFMLALKADGSVWIWGTPDGLVGIDGNLDPSPRRVTGANSITDIAAGYRHALLLRADGTVWSWGVNQYGQLGDGTVLNRLTPAPISGLANVKKIAAGNYTSFATLRDGTVLAWGAQNWATLGDGVDASSLSATKLPDIAPLSLAVAIQPPAKPRAGGKTTVTITVTNDSGVATTGTSTLTIQPGAGLMPVAPASGPWPCTTNNQTVTCGSADPLLAYGTLTFTLELTVSAAAAPATTLTAVVSTPGETNPTNNSSTLVIPVTPPPVGSMPVVLPLEVVYGNNGRARHRFTIRDADGAGNLYYVQFHIADPQVEYNSCLIHYDVAQNVFYLRNDDATDWWGLLPGTNTRIGNSQCELYAATSGAVKSGSDLNITIEVSFRSVFTGLHNIYTLAADRDNNVTDWQRLGLVDAFADTTLLELISVAPVTGSGASQLFTMTLRDGDGAGKVWFSQLNINATNSAAHGCYVHHDPATNVFYLLSDDGTTWAGLHGGSATEQVQNSQCLLKGKNSTNTANGQDLNITYDLQFKPGFAGQKDVFARASDVDGNLVQWKRTGSWKVQ
jgi:alpha-tubulin suppressor-like RCC1 family protein